MSENNVNVLLFNSKKGFQGNLIHSESFLLENCQVDAE